MMMALHMTADSAFLQHLKSDTEECKVVEKRKPKLRRVFLEKKMSAKERKLNCSSTFNLAFVSSFGLIYLKWTDPGLFVFMFTLFSLQFQKYKLKKGIFEFGAAGWKAQMKPQSYGGRPERPLLPPQFLVHLVV